MSVTIEESPMRSTDSPTELSRHTEMLDPYDYIGHAKVYHGLSAELAGSHECDQRKLIEATMIGSNAVRLARMSVEHSQCPDSVEPNRLLAEANFTTARAYALIGLSESPLGSWQNSGASRLKEGCTSLDKATERRRLEGDKRRDQLTADWGARIRVMAALFHGLGEQSRVDSFWDGIQALNLSRYAEASQEPERLYGAASGISSLERQEAKALGLTRESMLASFGISEMRGKHRTSRDIARKIL